jgi:MYXO-CTERM domain-containing protein
VLAALLASRTSAAAPIATRTVDVPCKGCILSVPATEAGAAPLLVLLHGDGGESPLRLVEAWERFAAPRGIALLALACPRDLGCHGSWWQWDGDPAWLAARVEAARAHARIDPARVALVGWSGGASYLGRRLEDLGPTFSAVVFHGGGIPPAGSCAARPLPTYFLVGDGNPLHHLAMRLRDDAARCGHEVTWDLIPRADHAGEWKAQAARAEAVLAWVSSHPRAAVAAVATPRDAGATPPPSTLASPDAAVTTPASAPPPTRPPSGCATASAGASPSPHPLVRMVALALVLGALRRRRARA